jgi:HEAT repeat protein
MESTMAESSKRFVALAIGLCVVLAQTHGAATAADGVDEEYAARLREVIKLLYSPQPATRDSAFAAVRRFGGMAVRPLMDVLKDKNPDARRVALCALSDLGPRARPAVPLLIDMLATKDDDTRWWAITTLGTIGPAAERARPLLIDILAQDKNAELRRASVVALRHMAHSDKTAMQAFTRALKDPDEEVRVISADALGRYKGPDLDLCIAALLESLNDKEATVRAIALEALGGIKPMKAEVVSALVAALGDSETGGYAERALRKLEKDARSALLAALEDKNPTVRWRAISCLGNGRTVPLPAMLTALGDSDDNVRATAAYYLIDLDEKIKPALKSLANSLNDSNKRVRWHIAWIHLKFAWDPQPATAVVLKLLEDPDDGFVAVVANSLRDIGTPAIPILRKALRNQNATVRKHAGLVLLAIGPGAVPDLLDALKDPDAGVRWQAVGNLCQVAYDRSKDELTARLVIASLMTALAKDANKEVRAEAATCLALLAAKATVAVPALIDALDDREPIVHYAAMRALAAIGPAAKPALPRLVEMVENAPADRPAQEEVRALIANVDNDSYALRSKATHALERLGRIAVTPLREALEKSPSLEANRRLRTLLDRLERQEREYGVAAVVALGGIGVEARSAVPVLLATLNDKARSREMHMCVARALGTIHSENPAVVAALTSMLRDKDGVVRLACVCGNESPPVAARAALISALSDSHSEFGMSVVAAAAKALGAMGPDAADAVPALIGLVKKKSHGAVAAAIALRKVGPAGKQAIPAFIDLLQHVDDDRDKVRVCEPCVPQGTIAVATAESLAHFGPDSRAAIPALIRALVCSNPSTRNSAVEALPRIDPDWEKNAIPILLKELTEAKTQSSRSQVIWVLMCRGPLAKDAVPHLLPFLQHADDDLRLGAVNALAAIGPAAAVAIPKLTPLLQDDSDVICQAAAVALKKIDDKMASR